MKLAQTSNLALVETEAIQALSEFLATPEGRASDDQAIKLWLFERGWPLTKWRAWSERIAAQLAMADPTSANPTLLLNRLDQRLERLAFKAEDNNDLKHAIQATEAQAKLSKIGGYAPPALQPNIAIQINTSTAHLASDADLLKIATSDPIPQTTDDSDPLLG